MLTRLLLRLTVVPSALCLLAAAPPAGAAEPTATVSAPATAAPALAAARPDFSGHWQLDPKASDDPAKMGAGPGGPGDHQGGGPGGGPGGGMRGRGGRGGTAGDPNQGSMPGESLDRTDDALNERDRAAGRQAAREFGQLEIFHEGDEFDLTDGMQISRMLRIGGEPTEVFTPRGSVKAAAAWEGDSLVVTERDPQGQVRRTRQFRLHPDGSALTVKEIRHLPGKDGSVVMTLVYRRAEAEVEP